MLAKEFRVQAGSWNDTQGIQRDIGVAVEEERRFGLYSRLVCSLVTAGDGVLVPREDSAADGIPDYSAFEAGAVATGGITNVTRKSENTVAPMCGTVCGYHLTSSKGLAVAGRGEKK